jgi:hypothetical protein
MTAFREPLPIMTESTESQTPKRGRGRPRAFERDDPVMQAVVAFGCRKQHRSVQHEAYMAKAIAALGMLENRTAYPHIWDTGRGEREKGAIKYRVLDELGRIATALGDEVAQILARKVDVAYADGALRTVAEGAEWLRRARLHLTGRKTDPALIQL